MSNFEKEISKLVAFTHSVLPDNPEIDKSYVKGLCIMLQGYDIKIIRSAFFEHLKTATRLPAPADIIKLIEGDEKSRKQDNEMKAQLYANEAWELIEKYYNRDKASPEITETINQMGGWDSVKNVMESDEPFWKQRFIKTYLGLQNNEARKAIGYSEKMDKRQIGATSAKDLLDFIKG